MNRRNKDLWAEQRNLHNELEELMPHHPLEAAPPSSAQQHPAHQYNHCSVCDSELGFTHITHFEYNTVTEEAFCYICHQGAKKQNHSLQ